MCGCRILPPHQNMCLGQKPKWLGELIRFQLVRINSLRQPNSSRWADFLQKSRPSPSRWFQLFAKIDWVQPLKKSAHEKRSSIALLTISSSSQCARGTSEPSSLTTCLSNQRQKDDDLSNKYMWFSLILRMIDLLCCYYFSNLYLRLSCARHL